MVRPLAMVMLLHGCGSGKPVAPETHPTLEAAPIDARHDDANDEVRAAARQLAPMTASAPKVTVPASLRGVTLYVHDLDGLVLFEDERAIARAELAAWAQAADLKVAEPSRAHEIIEHARRGEHAITGAACGAPLDTKAAVARWHDELGVHGGLEAHVRCAPACSLSITAAADQGATAYFTAPYDVTKPWRSELPHAFTQLVDAPDAQTPARGSTEPGSPRDPAADAALAPPATSSRGRACLDEGASTRLAVELDASSKVVRCEADTACVCKDLVGQAFDDVGGRSRAISTLTRPVTTKRAVHAELVLAADPALAGWAPTSLAAVEACSAKPFESDVTIDIDAAGAASNVKLASASPATTCIAAALATLRPPCPLAATKVHGHLVIRR